MQPLYRAARPSSASSRSAYRGALFFSALAALALAAVAGCGGQDGVKEMSQSTLLERMERGNAPLILDVRTRQEFSQGHIPGALNIPHSELGARLNEVGGKGTELVVHCESGRRAAIAEDLLRSAGFIEIYHLQGDMAAWRAAKLPMDRS